MFTVFGLLVYFILMALVIGGALAYMLATAVAEGVAAWQQWRLSAAVDRSLKLSTKAHYAAQKARARR